MQTLEGPPAWPKRLQQYMDLVKEGGYLIVAHNHLYSSSLAGQEVEKLLEDVVLTAGRWLRVARYEQGKKPADYPTTTWWNSRPSVVKQNFLLIFRKSESQ